MAKTTRRVYTYTRLEHAKLKKAILDSGTTIMCGQTGASFYVPSLSTKYIPHWQCIEWDGQLMLSGEAARHEMDKHLPEFKKIKNWRGDHIKLLNFRWPMFCQGQYYGPCVYFDLVGAYHQFYSRMFLDSGYPCGYGTLDLSPVAYALREHKSARNAVIGITRSTKVAMQNSNRCFSVATKNRFLSPPLWANLMGWLQEIASMAIELGAVYAMMDGFFFPRGDGATKFQNFMDEYGLTYRKKWGDIHIKGWGSYATDWGRVTGLYGKGARGKVNSIKTHYANPTKFLDWWRDAPDYRIWRYDNDLDKTPERVSAQATSII